ncbi:MAG: protein kinase [Archangiaceae bacterium]|nr:protein kinase [Archangiaceae bacterium]
MNRGCASDEVLAAFASGALPPADALEVEEHLDGCGACRVAVAAAASSEVGPSGGDSKTAPLGPAARAAVLPARFAAGEVVAQRYRIERLVAHGGMGEVYEAYDTELGTRLALKTVRAEIVGDPDALERFKRELKVARRITHPNVCRTFDLGTHVAASGRITFFTMEFLEGETLQHALRARGPMEPAEVLPLLEQMAGALAATHALGVVHRDFKSQNVMLVPAGQSPRVMVTDFGLARDLQASESSHTTLRLGGAGSPAYMAPEQVAGEPIGIAADVYALGVVLFEMLTGRVPFVGENPVATAIKRLTEPAPDVRSLKPGLDPRWAKAIRKCLERDPQRRWGSVTELVTHLQSAPPRRSSARRWAGLVAASAAVALAGLALSARGTAAAPPVAFAVGKTAAWARVELPPAATQVEAPAAARPARPPAAVKRSEPPPAEPPEANKAVPARDLMLDYPE